MTEKARISMIASEMRRWKWSRIKRLSERMEASWIHRAITILRDRMIARIKGTPLD